MARKPHLAGVKVQPATRELLPMLPPSTERLHIPPEKINGPRREASAIFLEHVRNYGIINPIVLQWSEETGFRLLGGSKRLWAAEALQLPAVPATVLEGEYNPSAVAIADNAQRSDNPVRDLVEIETLILEGHDLSAIAQATGLSRQAIGRRLKLTRLTKPWRRLFDDYELRVSFAEALSSLSSQAQGRVMRRVNAGEKLTAGLIAAERRAVAQNAASGIFEGFDDPAVVPCDLTVPIRQEQTRTLVEAAWQMVRAFRAADVSARTLGKLGPSVDKLETALKNAALIGGND